MHHHERQGCHKQQCMVGKCKPTRCKPTTGYSAIVFDETKSTAARAGAKSRLIGALCRIAVVGDGTFHSADPICSHLLLLGKVAHDDEVSPQMVVS